MKLITRLTYNQLKQNQEINRERNTLWHARGRRFDPDTLHKTKESLNCDFFVYKINFQLARAPRRLSGRSSRLRRDTLH